MLLTLLAGKPDIAGEMTLGLFLVGSQLSPQILTEVPVPIPHEAPRLITSLPLRMLFQALEALEALCVMEESPCLLR